MQKWGFDKLVIGTLEQPGCLPSVANELLLQIFTSGILDAKCILKVRIKRS